MSRDPTVPPADPAGLAATGTRPVDAPGKLAHAHPRVQRAYAYWRSIHPAQGLPGRQHLDPSQIRDLLPYVWLLDVQRVPLRLRYRLVGTAIARLVGRDFTGAWLDEAHPYIVGDERFAARWRHSVELGLSSWRRGRPLLFLLQKDYPEVENVYLPLAGDGRNVDMIFAYTVVYRSDGTAYD